MLTISIITVTYNAEKTLADCIKSVTSQTVDAEHIIIDGMSSDDTMCIVKANKAKLAKIVSEPDSGLYDAMNKGINLATGDIVGILNADDLYPSSDTLKKVMSVFAKPEVDACYGDLLYVSADNTDKIVREWVSGDYTTKSFYWGWMPPHPTFFVRKELYQQYGMFNRDLGSAADYEIMLRFLLKNNARALYIPEVLVRMRVGGVSNVSIKNRIIANKNDRAAWEVNNLRPYFWTLWLKPFRKIKQWFV